MSGPDYDYREIDDIIHGRIRLAVMAYLSGAGSADFPDLKARVGGTDGNLSVNLRKLEEARYIRIEKKFHNRKPRTICHLTNHGRNAWIAYIRRIEAMLSANGAE
ncbi:MAG: transcriptional regulator [Parvularculaceae bacterium]